MSMFRTDIPGRNPAYYPTQETIDWVLNSLGLPREWLTYTGGGTGPGPDFTWPDIPAIQIPGGDPLSIGLIAQRLSSMPPEVVAQEIRDSVRRMGVNGIPLNPRSIPPPGGGQPGPDQTGGGGGRPSGGGYTPWATATQGGGTQLAGAGNANQQGSIEALNALLSGIGPIPLTPNPVDVKSAMSAMGVPGQWQPRQSAFSFGPYMPIVPAGLASRRRY